MTAAVLHPGWSYPLPLRRRLDLQFRRLQFRGERAWGVKDPVALRYFQLGNEEYALLQMLDGRTSLPELRSRLERQFPGRRLSLPELHAFLGTLHRDGLIISDATGQGSRLWERRSEQQHREWIARLGNLLAIRFRGFHPGKFLDWLTPRCGWLFSPVALLGALGLVLSAAVLAMVEAREIQSRLPEFRDFFTPANLPALLISLACVKLLHELGHAVTCRHYGQECHEMGVLLFVGTPTLYCNVSDAWMLPDKGTRLAISAAGVAVELVIAAICTFLWWFSVPGAFHLLCLNLMFVCSVQTLVFNANPLLRYDGYYFLADWLEIPNLADQGTTALRGLIASWWLGLPRTDRTPCVRHYGLAAYALVSALYRMAIVVGIVWFLHRLLEPYRAELAADFLGFTVLAGLLVGAVSFGRRLTDEAQRRREEFEWPKALRRIGVTLLLAALLLLTPLPQRIAAPGVVEPAGAQRVYVSVSGRVIFALPAGSTVQDGQSLVQLENLELRGELEKLTGDRDRQKLHLQNLERRRGDDPAVEAQLPSAQAALADLEERVVRRQLELAELTIKAPRSGRLFPPPRELAHHSEGVLPQRRGTPLDQSNLQSTLETGTLCGLVGDPDRLEVALIVDQTDVSEIVVGRPVKLWLPQPEAAFLKGTVLDISANDLKIVPREFAPNTELATRTDATGTSKPQNASYRVRVSLDGPCRLPAGTQCRAKIQAEPLSLLRRAVRFVQRTFQFR